MEVIAIGLLGLAGKYISDRFQNNTDDEYIENTEDDDETLEYNKDYTTQETYATSVNGFDQKKRVQDTMNNVTAEKKQMSESPHTKNIIPPLFNKRVYALDAENKYLSAATGSHFKDTRGQSMLDIYKNSDNLMEGPVNSLTTLDEQFSPMMIDRDEKPVPENQGKLTLPSDWTPFKGEDDDMTYKIFNKDELIHNNMQPFFKDRGMLITQDNSRNMEQKLDIYTGSSRFYFAKREVPNITENFESGFSTAYQPIPQLSYTRGTPVQIDLVNDRYFSGKERKNELPFDQIRVTPGLNLKPFEDGKSGFQDPFKPHYNTIDELRRADNPQISATLVPTKGASGQGKSAIIGDVVNKKPQTYGTLGVDYDVSANFSNVGGTTDKGNFNFDKARRGNAEVVEQGPAGSNNREIIPDISNFGSIKDPFKRLLPGLNQSVMSSQNSIPILDQSSYVNPITQRSTANSTYTAGMGGANGGAGEVSEYQMTVTNRLNTNANFTGSMGNSSGGAGDMSEYQAMATNRINTQEQFTGAMGNTSGGAGDMSEYQAMATNRITTQDKFTGGMGNTSGGAGDMSAYQFTPTQRFNTNASFTGSMGNSSGGLGEVSDYQFTPTQRFNMNTNFTGSMGGSSAGEVSEYQFTPTQRFNMNTNFTGSMGGSSAGEVSEYQFTPTQRYDMHDNFTGSMGGGNNVGEMSKYQATATNRIVSNSLIGTGGDQIGGGGYYSTVTNPVATMRVVSNNLIGGMGMDNSIGGYIAETTQNVPTYRQTQNFDYAGGIHTINGTQMPTTGEGERNMYFRDNKQALLERLPPTPVNSFVGPTPESMYSMSLKDLPSVEMMQMGSSTTTDYLPFYSKLKDINIPSTYPAFNPADMVYNNPYINNVILQSVPNIENPTVGYAATNTMSIPNNNTNGFFFQNSNDQIKNN